MQKDCLLFQLDNELYTPLFPAKYTKYTKGDPQITVGNGALSIGETLNISALLIEKEYVGSFITEGPSHCLLNKFMRVEARGLKL